MRASTNGEAAAKGGGLHARIHRLVTNAAIVRLAALSVGLTTLGFLGQCLATPARASAPALAASSSPATVPSSVASVAIPVPGPCADSGRANVMNANAHAHATVNANANDASGATASLVELNTATQEDLRRLPGIGPRRATAILELRAKLGGFRKLEDLMRVRGIGRGAMKRLRPLVTVNVGPPKD